MAKETCRRLRLGDHMYLANVPKDGPEACGRYASLDGMILDADGFPEYNDRQVSPGSRLLGCYGW